MTNNELRSHFYEPGKGHGLSHDPLRAILGPRPIGWISSVSSDGTANLAPYSFFSMLCDKPAILGFSSIGQKDTLRNIRDTGVFAWNLVTAQQSEAMNVSSANWANDVDEFAIAGLEKSASRMINCPRVSGAPVTMECRLCEIIQLHDAQAASADAWLVLGEIVGVHIDATCLSDGRFRTEQAGIILRAGYSGDYFRIDEKGLFRMPRPRL